MGSFIDIRGDGAARFQGYLSLPPAGRGPGVIILQEIFGVNAAIRAVADLYAQEGYVALAPDLFWRLRERVDLGYSDAEFTEALGLLQRLDVATAVSDIGIAADALASRPECDGKLGVVGFCLGGTLALLAAGDRRFGAAASYYPAMLEERLEALDRVSCPTVVHIGTADQLITPEVFSRIQERARGNASIRIYQYPDSDHAFANPMRPGYRPHSANMAHTRCLEVLRPAIGPRYDLSQMWEQHMAQEYAVLDPAATVDTMVDDAYVNHVPNLTGGCGRKDLFNFYRHHFTNCHPGQFHIEPISRTIGVDHIVDEAIFCFTHDREIDYLLPGIAPTGKYVEIPFVAVVAFRGSKLCHEHIYYDNATVLKQLGLAEFGGLPVSGREQAAKIRDENSVPSNAFIPGWNPQR